MARSANRLARQEPISPVPSGLAATFMGPADPRTREEHMTFSDRYAVDQEMNVRNFLGSRCRDCGFINEPDPAYVVCLPRDLRCAACGLSVPHPDVVVAPGVNPLAQVHRHFEPLIWSECARA
jgi:hypothetical protein